MPFSAARAAFWASGVLILPASASFWYPATTVIGPASPPTERKRDLLVRTGAQHPGQRLDGDVAGRRRLAVGPLEFAVHLFAVHLHAAGSLDAHPDDVTTHVENGDDDVVADHDTFAGTSGKDEHAPVPLRPLGDRGRIPDFTRQAVGRAPAGRYRSARAVPPGGGAAAR